MPYRFVVILFFLLFAAVSYFLGSVNFAIIVTKFFTGRDIRKAGSGNAGMTNVMRMVGFWPGLITLLCDFGKAVLAVSLGKYLLARCLLSTAPSIVSDASQQMLEYGVAVAPIYGASICGLFCILGHMYPIFFRFKGGKGIACIAGAIFIIDWRVLAILLAIFIAVFLISRIISLASVIAAVCYPVVTYLCFTLLPASDSINQAALSAYRPLGIPITVFVTLSAICFALLALLKHAENIKRLLRGEEKKFKISKVRIKK